MKKFALFVALPLLVSLALGQFVFPRRDYHDHAEDLYKEDPFITHYRKEFFSVFEGDYPRFEKAYAEINEMVRRNPKDARARIWKGNGQTVEAGLLKSKGKAAESIALLALSRATMDQAVALRPKDPNIYMMQAATLYIQGQYWPDESLPKEAWSELRDDCLKFIKFLGPKLPRVSIHVRGETYGELGVAYLMLGEKDQARRAFEKLIALDPNTDYSARAKKELAKLGEVK